MLADLCPRNQVCERRWPAIVNSERLKAIQDRPPSEGSVSTRLASHTR